MTFTITKAKLAIAILAVALLVPATAFATHSFSDVPDGVFYTDAVEWAKANGMTTGSPSGADTFKPLDPVTRGENITFAKRYDDFVVQPALATNAAAIAGLGFSKMYWAWVNSSGTLFTGTSSAGVSATRSATGEYVVTFPVDVNACSWSVAHRSVDGLLVFLDPNFDDEPLFDLSTRVTGFFPFATSHPADIRVSVTNDAGVSKNSEFQLQVLC